MFVGGGDGVGEHAREDGGGHVQAASVSLQDVSDNFSFLWISFCESQIFDISRSLWFSYRDFKNP
jgi:hypothetical protein